MCPAAELCKLDDVTHIGAMDNTVATIAPARLSFTHEAITVWLAPGKRGQKRREAGGPGG